MMDAAEQTLLNILEDTNNRLLRAERVIESLTKQVADKPAAQPPYADDFDDALRKLGNAMDGSKVHAIAILRGLTGAGLKECIDAVERMMGEGK